MTHDIIQPRRLQRARKKGAPLPEGARWCGRGTIRVNPFDRRGFGHMKSVKHHDRWLRGHMGALTLERLGFSPSEIDAMFRMRARLLASLDELEGQDLVCWCALTAPCHVDNIIRLVVEFAESRRKAA